MNAGPATRLRLTVLMVLGLALALGSFWYLENTRKELADMLPKVQRTEPDYFIDRFEYVRMSTTGQPRYKVSGVRMTHHPLDDSFQIRQPVVRSLGDERPPMTIVADRARLEDLNSRLHMLDHVRVDRPATPQSQPFRLDTEQLLILPDEDIMQSDQAVEMALGSARMSGVGMFANNATGELKLLNQTKVHYPPPTSR
jgi:lipopolysaccharide export system protein LptC